MPELREVQVKCSNNSTFSVSVKFIFLVTLIFHEINLIRKYLFIDSYWHDNT